MKFVIYEVDPSTFEKGKTSFRAEVASERPVKVLSCSKVDDLYSHLRSLIDEGRIEYQSYSEDSVEYVDMINEHIKDGITRFGILQNKESSLYKFCNEKFHAL